MKQNCADGKVVGFLIVLGTVLLLFKGTEGLDTGKDNSTGVAIFSHDNADFGEDGDFAFGDSSEQLPCSDLNGYAFHNETKKCWPVGDRGPCPFLMKFQTDPEHEGFGDCDCIPMRNCIGRPRTYYVNDTESETGRCHLIYSRGPCSAGQWLVFNEDKKPECRPNPCGKQIKSPKSQDFIFPHEGKCYKTGTRAFCDEGQIVYISSSDLKPRCHTTKPVCRFYIFTAKTLSCRPGSKLDVTGRCNHMREMDEEEK